jgi:hypothetical protein
MFDNSKQSLFVKINKNDKKKSHIGFPTQQRLIFFKWEKKAKCSKLKEK